MKKNFLKILTVIIAFTFCVFSFSACGCNDDNAISFTNDFVKGYDEGIPNDYYEKLTYVVSYKEDMYGYSISDILNKNDFSFKDGIYVTELNRLDTIPVEELKNNDIVKSLSDTEKIFSLRTTFSMPVTYFEGTERQKEFTDTIETVVYFCSQAMSFAPIYSKVTANYSVFSVLGDEISIENVSYVSTVIYGKESYASTLSQPEKENQTSTKEYDFKCLIDNAQLLFALRNFEVTEEAPRGLDVVSPNYAEHTTLGVYYEQSLTEKFTGTLNDSEISEEIKLDKIYYKVNSAKNSGKDHYVFILNEEHNGAIMNNSYVYKYVQPLITYGSFEVMGSLEFTLTDINTKA